MAIQQRRCASPSSHASSYLGLPKTIGIIPPPLGPIDLDTQQCRHTMVEPRTTAQTQLGFSARRRSINPTMAPSRPPRLTFDSKRAHPCPAPPISSSAFNLEPVLPFHRRRTQVQSRLSHSLDATEPSSLRRLSA
ncbi:hypothetical protein M0R45_026559 [Rubus argutus]|uniref:Uncharacterized protein n=1 Tax=Rubus argutus TaxID=59490 RepID=A0AAW1WXY6_RUBAR